MIQLTAAAAFFVMIHLLISGTSVRDGVVRRIGEGPYMGLFSLLSVAGLTWMILAYGQARGEVWNTVYWGVGPATRHTQILLQLIAVFFIVIGLTTPNPTSVKQEGVLEREDAVKGMLRITRHPFLWGVAIWASGHLIVNGDRASMTLFGTLLILAQAAHVLERAGAEAVLICANTMHLVADDVAAAISVPLIHIGDATAQALVDQGLKRPLLLATRFTMEEAFYRDRLESFGLDPMIPGEGARERLHAIIYDELCQGVIDVGSRTAIIERGRAEGADSVIFGCTELGLLLEADGVGLPVVDSALAHVNAALDFALAEPA